uniref:MAM domain-containing protein n=1 Tax=Parastrongyloides trichosuri TaxID=131310 RepID=A0A0N4ZCN5_PARTI
MISQRYVFFGLYILIFITLFPNYVTSCMPGYEQERAKIKQYLGLEWVENGLDLLDSKTLRTIRHSEDLNCDFQKVETCNWKNVDHHEKLDSMDFFLFTKTDHVEFPYLRVAPGPSKLSEGDNLIFVGDRKREEQTAIIRSALIPCQKDTGKLTLDYWTYNGARLEVFMYEKSENGDIKKIHEKLYVDCGTVSLNTNCYVNIPERKTPFYLAIRAYDISNVEGSFVMVDNIKYEADLCKVELDLGEDFEEKILITGANGDYISSSTDLYCSEWDSNCRWRNSISGVGTWKMSHKSPSEKNLLNITGTFNKPIKNFAFMYIEQYTKGPYTMLVSDPIPCQTNEKSFLQFRTWASKNVHLNVCALSLEKEVLECHPILLSQSPASIKYHFTPKKNFMYGIRIDSVDENSDNFIAIDDIIYSATLCDDAKNAYDYGNDFYVTELLSTIVNRPLHTTNDLQCDFTKRGLDCVWGNGDNSENILWKVGLGNINMHKFNSLTGTNIIPDGEFGIANFTQPGIAVLLSETIKCTNGDSSLSLKYWQTGHANLKVCLIDARAMTVIDCQPVTLEQPGPVIIDIPQITSPFRLSLQAESTNQGTIIVDDINMEGTICSTTTNLVKHSKSSRAFGATTYQLTKKVNEIPDPNVCRLLSCDFNLNSSCLFNSEHLPSSRAEFVLTNKAMWAVLSKENRIAMLASPIFSLNTAAKFHFDYIIYEGNVDVFVCQDSVKRAFDTCFKVSQTSYGNKDNKEPMHNKWRHEYAELLPSDIRLYIVVKFSEGSTTRRARISIDNLILRDVENNDIC